MEKRDVLRIKELNLDRKLKSLRQVISEYSPTYFLK